METIGIILNVGSDHAERFEQRFREQEVAVWADLHARGTLVMATLTRLDITTHPFPGVVQFLVVAIFADGEGHHLHDSDPRFQRWNAEADAYQAQEPFVFGGETIASVGG